MDAETEKFLKAIKKALVEDEILTEEEAAQKLKCLPKHVYYYYKTGQLKGRLVGRGRRRYLWSEVLKFMRREGGS